MRKYGQVLRIRSEVMDKLGEITGIFPAGQNREGVDMYQVVFNGVKIKLDEQFISAVFEEVKETPIITEPPVLEERKPEKKKVKVEKPTEKPKRRSR